MVENAAPTTIQTITRMIELVHLGPRESGAPRQTRSGTGIVAVASGLVQVQVAGQTPAVRHGEVLVADGEQIAGWRNLGQTEAELFWIAYPAGA
jgi:quercetin dioxygenase-like cupin family protein